MGRGCCINPVSGRRLPIDEQRSIRPSRRRSQERIAWRASSPFRRDIITAVKNSFALLIMGMLLAACSSETAPTMQSKAPAAAAPPAATKSPDENAALDALHKINEAQATYFKLNRRYALSFEELVDARLISSEPSAAQTGYDFKLRPAADAQTYKLFVVPADSNAVTARRFFMDQTGAIHGESGKDATADSPAVK